MSDNRVSHTFRVSSHVITTKQPTPCTNLRQHGNNYYFLTKTTFPVAQTNQNQTCHQQTNEPKKKPRCADSGLLLFPMGISLFSQFSLARGPCHVISACTPSGLRKRLQLVVFGTGRNVVHELYLLQVDAPGLVPEPFGQEPFLWRPQQVHSLLHPSHLARQSTVLEIWEHRDSAPAKD